MEHQTTTLTLRWGLFLVAAGSLVGCQQPAPAADTAQQQVLTPTEELLLASTKVALPPPGITAADLPEPNSQGAQLIVQYCVTCHNLPSPGSHSATDWPRYIRRMWLRADRMTDSHNVPSPTAAERQVILQYLMDHALRVSSGSLPAGPGREFFAQTCSACHELPDPTEHSPQDWVAVVRRMMQHMETMQNRTVTPDQYQRLVLYLETASRAG